MQQFEKVYIEKSALSSPIARRAKLFFSPSCIKVIKNKSDLPWINGSTKHRYNGALSSSQMDCSKKYLLLSSFQGKFFKRCPGAKPGLMCCNYFVLNLGQHCEMDCSYCYLQNFINFPYVVIYTNIESALAELSGLSKDMDHQPLRVGTGEITDSLSLDDLTLYSARLVDYFRQRPHWTLEFKTKSANIKNFVHKGPVKNVIVSWSLNPQYIIEKEEHGTATLDARLQAARQCIDHGFSVAFHLDPLIYHHGWKKHYTDLITRIQRMFRPEELAHISLGALRFQPEQRHIMRERFGMTSLVTQGEYFKSADGKLRYSNQIRQEMFRFVIHQFQERSPSSKKWNIFLCMENKENWLSTIGHVPWKANSQQTQSLFNLKPVQVFKKQSRKERHFFS